MNRTHGALLAGLAVVCAGVISVSHKDSRPDTPVAQATKAKPVPRVGKSSSREDLQISRRDSGFLRKDLPHLPPPQESQHAAGSAEERNWVENRVSQIRDLAWFNDSESLLKILAELRNPLPEIRTAALAAVVAFGSGEAIPYLEAFAQDTRDPLEQKALNDAVEHLKIPSFLDGLDVQPDQPPDGGDAPAE